MYCQACGTKNATGAKVCSRCRTKLFTSESQRAVFQQSSAQAAAGSDTRTPPVNGTKAAAPPGKSKGSGGAFAWIIPLLLLGVVLACLSLLHKYELKLNCDVLALQENAQAEALEGHYVKATALLDSAVAKRPAYEALLQDRTVAAEAAQWQLQLQSASEDLKEQQIQASETSIDAVAQELVGREEPVFAALRKELSATQVKLAVMKVKGELDKLNTVDALADKLKSVKKLEGDEAEAVKKQITSKLAGLSYNAAEELLKQKDFSGALQAVDKGLSYAPEDEQLNAYRKRIKNEKLAFEQAEKARIELAVQQAAEEDFNNRTSAVVMTGYTATLDDYGDLQITGTIRNDATRTISSVDLTLGIYDESGTYLGQTYASVYPYSLAPDEPGDFTASYYGVYQQAQVSVVKATWYLE